MKKLSVLSILLIVGVISGICNIVNPVTWTTNIEISGTQATATFTANIEKGYHIYGMEQMSDGPVATSINFENTIGLEPVGSMTVSSQPIKPVDRAFDLELEYWEGTVTFTQTFNIVDPSAASALNGTIRYMACSGTSCLPPAKESFSLPLNTQVGTAPAVEPATGETVLTNSKHEKLPDEQINEDIYSPVDTSVIADMPVKNNEWWSLLLMGFFGGLLALLTPCVWPMIPMTLSFFLKKTKSRAKAIRDAIIYGLSIIIIYLGLGLAITLLFGAGKLNDIATSAVFNIIFFALLVVFAISFFGAFDIKLPSKWSNAIDSKAESTTGYLSIFFMAFTLVLVSFSCTGPIIGTLLVEAAGNGSIVGPALGMGGFALGLAIPFTVFAVFPSLLKEMPKSGGWMNSVKVVLGFIELILSLKFLSVADLAYNWQSLDREVFLAIWIVLFVLLGMYLLGKLRFAHDSDKGHTGVGGFFLAVCSFSFAVYLLPGMWGAPLKAISAFAPPLSTQDFNLYGGEIHEFTDYEEGMKFARDNNIPVMLDFSGYACVNCRKMEGAVFDTEEVKDILNKDYVFIKLMVDEKAELAKPYSVVENGKSVLIETVGDKWSYLQRHKFNINSQPYYVLLNGKGELLAEPRAYDENVPAFVEWLEKGIVNFEHQKKND